MAILQEQALRLAEKIVDVAVTLENVDTDDCQIAPSDGWGAASVNVYLPGNINIRIEEYRRKISEWRNESTGKLKVSLSPIYSPNSTAYGYGARSYREKKDGSWNPKLFEYVIEYIKYSINRQATRMNKEVAYAEASDYIEEKGFYTFGGFSPTSTSQDGEYVPAVQVKVTLTLEQFDRMADFLDEIDVKVKLRR